jgi:hypothetical protein
MVACIHEAGTSVLSSLGKRTPLNCLPFKVSNNETHNTIYFFSHAVRLGIDLESIAMTHFNGRDG